MEPNTEAGTALIAGTAEEGGTDITVLTQETVTGIAAHAVTSIATLTGIGAEAARGERAGRSR